MKHTYSKHFFVNFLSFCVSTKIKPDGSNFSFTFTILGIHQKLKVISIMGLQKQLCVSLQDGSKKSLNMLKQ